MGRKAAPPGWRGVYQRLLDMRAGRTAPVDKLLHCSAGESGPVVAQRERYHCLVSLVLGCQTRDSVTLTVMQELQQLGLTVQALQSPQQDCYQYLPQMAAQACNLVTTCLCVDWTGRVSWPRPCHACPPCCGGWGCSTARRRTCTCCPGSW